MSKFRLIMELECPGPLDCIERDHYFNDPENLSGIERDMRNAGLLIDEEHIMSTKFRAVDEGVFEEEMSLADEEAQ